MTGKFGEIHSRLACRICAANDIIIPITVGKRLGHGRVIIHSRPNQAIQAGNLQFSISNACGNDERLAADFRSVCQLQYTGGAFDPDTLDFLGRENLRAETPRLGNSTSGEVIAAEPRGEP